MSLDQSKPHKGRIGPWIKVPISSGHFIFGYRPDDQVNPERDRCRYTSPVVAYDGDQVETWNSRYTLVGDEQEEITVAGQPLNARGVRLRMMFDQPL